MNKLFVLACALALSYGIARAAPPVSTWECEARRVWPTAASGAVADTLPRFAADSLVTTDSVNVYNARYVLLIAVGSGTDSLSTVLMQSQLPGTASWNGSGGVSALPYSAFTYGAMNPNTITNAGKAIWAVFNETTVASSTPVPIANSYFRWRFRSGDLRRYNAPLSATLASTGNVSVYALVWR